MKAAIYRRVRMDPLLTWTAAPFRGVLGTGLSSVSGGAIVSYATNQVTGNGVDGNPTATVVPK